MAETQKSIIKASIRRVRQKSRINFSENLKKTEGNNHLIIHWDGKPLEDITSSEIVDLLPVQISGIGEEHLLGVPKLDHGKGKDIPKAAHHLITEWNL